MNKIYRIEKDGLKIIIEVYPIDKQGKRGGTLVESNLNKFLGVQENPHQDTLIESLLLAHATAGVKIDSYAYIEGLMTSLEIWRNQD